MNDRSPDALGNLFLCPSAGDNIVFAYAAHRRGSVMVREAKQE